MENDNYNVSWAAPEFEKANFSTNWYWASIGISIALIAVAIWQQNFLFGLFIVIAEILLMAVSMQEPQMYHFHVSPVGVRIGDHKFFPVKELKGYTINTDEGDDWAHLLLHTHGHISPVVKIHMPHEHVNNVHLVLNETLPHLPYSDTLSDTFERLIKF